MIPGQGYQAKMNTNTQLNLSGNMIPYNYSISLYSGWSLLAYLHQECYNFQVEEWKAELEKLLSQYQQYCNIINGAYYGLSFSGTSIGKISNCNFYNNDFGVKAFDNTNLEIENSNFIDNQTYGLGIITEDPIVNISYSNSWNNSDGDYWENCPG